MIDYHHNHTQWKLSCRRRRRMRTANVVLMTLLFLILSVLSSLSLSGCGMEDNRDICCEGVFIEYRYCRSRTDLFSDYISGMRQFLFDGNGNFLYELPPDNRQMETQERHLQILTPGLYTLVTLCNSENGGGTPPGITSAELSSLKEMAIKASGQQEGAPYPNTGKLYWSVCSFLAETGKGKRCLNDLSNIHCKLSVRVTWESNADVLPGEYSLELDPVPSGYNLDPQQSSAMILWQDKTVPPPPYGEKPTPLKNRIVHQFPKTTEHSCTHRIRVSLYSLALEGEFLTFRYTDTRIPNLRIYRNNRPITPSLSLARAFREWGWRPEEHSEQNYRIDIRLMKNGEIHISQAMNSSVLDWQDGGTFEKKNNN